MVTATAGFARLRQTRLRAADRRSRDPPHRDLRRRARIPRCARDRNRVADDADKRAALRNAGYLVWSFGHDDLQRFKAGDAVGAGLVRPEGGKRRHQPVPRPAGPGAAAGEGSGIATARVHGRPGHRRHGSTSADWMPYLFVRNDNRAHADSDRRRRRGDRGTRRSGALHRGRARHVLDVRRGWRHRHRRSAHHHRTAARGARRRRPRRPSGVTWTARRGRSGCDCRTGWASATGTASPPAPCWTSLRSAVRSDGVQERLLCRRVAGVSRRGRVGRRTRAHPAPSPMRARPYRCWAIETDDGDVIDMAWADARIGVAFDDGAEAPRRLDAVSGRTPRRSSRR